jgi:octaprenyl-diphosphate synthase
MMVTVGSMRIMEILSQTSNIIAAGEVEQLERAGNPDTTEAQYLQVITRKTAVLFAAAARGGAVLAGADADTEEQAHQYGLQLGIAFQLIDDVLDYDGDPEQLGKNVGDDLAEGKMTLPLIHTVAAGSEADARVVREAIAARDRERIDAVLAAVRRAGGIEYARTRAEAYRLGAVRQLDAMPSSPFLDNLLAIASIAVVRAA